MPKKKRNPINNKEFLKEISLSKNNNKLNDRSLEIYIMILDKLIKEKLFYKDPKDGEDCRSNAILVFLKNWNKFDPKKSSNPFSFYTQMIKNALAQEWNRLRKNNKNIYPLDILK